MLIVLKGHILVNLYISNIGIKIVERLKYIIQFLGTLSVEFCELFSSIITQSQTDTEQDMKT